MTDEPIWLDVADVLWAHNEQVREHGGPPGVRDMGALEASLARPRHKWALDASIDVAGLAAAYGFAFARNHVFVDGNKRTALVATEWFLELNGHELVVSDEACVATMVGLAAGELSEEKFADWLRRHSKSRPEETPEEKGGTT